jgi:phosphoribosylformimino-5-aminoimidazole carboxamide ribotide isomerase
MTIYPAIDLREGVAVRLAQGDYERQTRYATDPVVLAEGYRDAGATWLHVVDLDAARSGRAQNLECVRALARIDRLRVQAGGGVRSDSDVETLLDAGVTCVVVGSLAVREPERVMEWLARFGSERICVALDTRADPAGRWRLPVAGWTEGTDAILDGLLERYVGASALRHVLCTDIARDGMLAGPNVELYRDLSARYPTIAFQASGGVRDAADIAALRDAGAAGAIVGKALLDGRVGLAELLEC